MAENHSSSCLYNSSNLINGVPNFHVESSRTRSPLTDNLSVGPRGNNRRRCRHGRGIGSMNMDELDYYKALKRLIEGRNLSESQMIIELTKDHLHELMIDPFGNVFVQSLLGFCNETFINHLLFSLITKENLFVAVCLDNLGHGALMKLMKRLRCPNQQSTIALVISCHVVTLAKSFQGGHEVLKCCFQTLSLQANELILLRIAKSCSELVKDQAGCCILQVCIEYATPQVREMIVTPLIQDVENLSRHAYGNYVIQFMIELDGGNIGRRIIKELKKKFVGLSEDKYGSNVVEKCLCCGEGDAAHGIILEIMENNHNLIRVCGHEYGNYVVQRAIKVAKGEVYKSLVKAINSSRLHLQYNPYGRNVINAAKKSKCI